MNKSVVDRIAKVLNQHLTPSGHRFDQLVEVLIADRVPELLGALHDCIESDVTFSVKLALDFAPHILDHVQVGRLGRPVHFVDRVLRKNAMVARAV